MVFCLWAWVVLAAEPSSALTDICIIHVDFRRSCFHLEIADEPDERNFGLMERRFLAPRHGMLFDFGEPQQVGMWMKNTFIPLDMVFLDGNGYVVSVHRGTRPHSLEIISPSMPVRYTLELNAGEVGVYGIKVGSRLLRMTNN